MLCLSEFVFVWVVSCPAPVRACMQVHAVYLEPQEWVPEGDGALLTPSLKNKRHALAKAYASAIAVMYDSLGEDA